MIYPSYLVHYLQRILQQIVVEIFVEVQHEVNEDLLHLSPLYGGHLDVAHIAVIEARDEEGGVFETRSEEVVVAIGLPLVPGQHSFCPVADEEEGSALVTCLTAACEVDRFAAEVERGEDVFIVCLASDIIDQVVGRLSDGPLFCIDHEVIVEMLSRPDPAFLVDLILLLLFPLPVGAADQRKHFIFILPNIVDEDLHVVHVVERHQGVGNTHRPLHLRIALQTERSELDHLTLLRIEPGQLRMAVGLDNRELFVFHFLIMDEYGSEICVVFVVVVGDREAIFVGILAFDDAEVLGFVKGVYVDGVAIDVMELVVDLCGGSGFQVDEINGGVGSVEHYDFLLAEHCKSADHAVVMIAVEELTLGVEVHDGFRFAWMHNCREDNCAVVGSGEGGDFVDGEVEVDIGPILQYHSG